MIKNKKDLKFYLKQDKKALKIPHKRKFPRPLIDDVWKFEIVLRKYEFYINNNKKIRGILFHIIFLRLSEKLGISIPPNVFDYGLSIAHLGTIAVNNNAKIGKNCRIHEGVTIGATNGEKRAAVIGDNCFIGSGAKVIGDIQLGKNIAIGAGAVVVKDCLENKVTLAGVPAKIVSHNGSMSNL